MTLREEFEKAFETDGWSLDHDFGLALWAAKWMAERCAKVAESLMTGEKEESHESAKDARSFVTAYTIRQLAKELQ